MKTSLELPVDDLPRDIQIDDLKDAVFRIGEKDAAFGALLSHVETLNIRVPKKFEAVEALRFVVIDFGLGAAITVEAFKQGFSAAWPKIKEYVRRGRGNR